MESNRLTVRQEFARQADSFRARRTLFGDQRLADWMARAVALSGTDTVLDVGGGAGHLDRALTGRARQFVVADLTPEMLAAGRDAAEEEGAADVLFLQADAAELPFADRSFDVVWSRFAFHHMPRIEPVLAEMRRVCRPDGRVALLDVVALDDAVRDEHVRLEVLRDPSHTTHFTEQQLTSAFTAAGIGLTRSLATEYRMDAESWLEQALTADPERAAILAALEADAAGREPTGLRPVRDDDGRWTIEQRWLLLAGRTGGADGAG
jgi:ubiquinone/menaquinone biosynthesis C-methylase UbiE